MTLWLRQAKYAGKILRCAENDSKARHAAKEARRRAKGLACKAESPARLAKALARKSDICRRQIKQPCGNVRRAAL